MQVMAQPSADVVALRNIPRTLLRPYSSAVDIWALGILIHEALTGKTPFCHPDAAVVALKAQFAAPCRLSGHASAECQAFVDAVLHKQPGKRPSAATLLQHPWVQKLIANAALPSKPCRWAVVSLLQVLLNTSV
jgi:serine/threonine protein kinase